MEINSENYSIGNKAMSNVLLLYFHILSEKGITNDQTVYLDSESFDPDLLINVVVCDSESADIDQSLIREGVVIYWLCELNDAVSEYDDSFHDYPYFNEVFKKLELVRDLYPEISDVLDQISVKESKVDYKQYNHSLSVAVRKYVFERMQNLVWQSEL